MKTNNKSELIIIRGTPGAGKSSLGLRLKVKFPHGAFIEIDNFRGMLNTVDWSDSVQHHIALEGAAAAAKSFIYSKAIPVIVADMFLPVELDFFLEKIKGTQVRIFSLQADEITLSQRLTDRKEGFKDIAKAVAINSQISDSRKLNEIVINTSALTKNEVATEFLRELLA